MTSGRRVKPLPPTTQEARDATLDTEGAVEASPSGEGETGPTSPTPPTTRVDVSSTLPAPTDTSGPYALRKRRRGKQGGNGTDSVSPLTKRNKRDVATETELVTTPTPQPDETEESRCDESIPPELAVGHLIEPMNLLRNTLSTCLAKIQRLDTTASPTPPALQVPTSTHPPHIPSNLGAFPSPSPSNHCWGLLISQCDMPHARLYGSSFTVGRNSRCNLVLHDGSVSGLLFRILYCSPSMVLCESTSNSGILLVNGSALRKGSRVPLRSGDELVIPASKTRYNYVFQHTEDPKDPKPISLLPAMLFSDSSKVDDKRKGSLRTTSAALPVATSSGGSVLGKERPLPVWDSYVPLSSTAPAKEGTKGPRPTDPGGSMDMEGYDEFLSSCDLRHAKEKGRVELVGLGDVQATAELMDDKEEKEEKEEKVEKEKDEPRESDLDEGGQGLVSDAPPLKCIAEPSTTELSSEGHGNTQDDNLEALVNTLKKSFKEDYVKRMIFANDLTSSFDTLPYFVSPDFRELLLTSVYVFLQRRDFVQFTSELSTVSRRILFSGPTGTETMQEKVCMALAKYFGAAFLVLEELVSGDDPPLPESPARESLLSLEIPSLDDDGGDEGLGVLWPPFSERRRERFGLDRIESLRKTAQLSAAKIRRFKKGDRVRFVGSSSSSSSSLGSFPSASKGTLGPSPGAKGVVVMTFEDNPQRVGVCFEKVIPGGSDMGDPRICERKRGFFVNASSLRYENDMSESNEAAAIEALFEVAVGDGTSPCILFIRNAEKIMSSTTDRYQKFKKELDALERRNVPVVVIGSTTSADPRRERSSGTPYTLSKPGHHSLLDLSLFDHLSRSDDRIKETSKVSKVARLLPNRIAINAPQDESRLSSWKTLIERDVEDERERVNLKALRKIFEKSKIACDVDSCRFLRDQIFSTEALEKIVGGSVSHQLMGTEGDVSVPEARMDLSGASLEHGIRLYTAIQAEGMSLSKSLKDVVPENEFERRLLSEVIPPHEVGVKFSDIGALDTVKESLRELVMLPLKRPELFRKGNLTKPCKGILLFGPPGTGKTMLAKAVATEASANFINIAMSSIASKWFGEGEKYARAVFTLASKISPCVIFIDEVDSLLGKREKFGEHEAMRKIKNEVMAAWDGLKTKEFERVLVLAATNRPFDLDDAVLRRFQRRFLVDLPDRANRLKILKVILHKEDLVPNIDLQELAAATSGYSGSDLKNLCVTAAYRPIREVLDAEKTRESDESPTTSREDELGTPHIRPLCEKDFMAAKSQISSSVSEDAFAIAELRRWNEMYGEGGSQSKHTLSYFM